MLAIGKDHEPVVAARFHALTEARQAIGYAIDYDGIVKSMLGGAALRPAHYLPIGVSGSTDASANPFAVRNAFSSLAMRSC